MLHEYDVQLLHANPLIAVADEFLDDAACARLMELAEGKTERALVLNAEQGTAETDNRTNSDCAFDAALVPEVAALIDRLAPIVGLPVSHA